MRCFAPASSPAPVRCRWYLRMLMGANSQFLLVSGHKNTTFCPPRKRYVMSAATYRRLIEAVRLT